MAYLFNRDKNHILKILNYVKIYQKNGLILWIE